LEFGYTGKTAARIWHLARAALTERTG
jgi:hypothetical protein